MIPYDGKNRATVNYLKTIYFDYPEWTPCTVAFLPATWMRHGSDLEEIVLAHPRVFPHYRRGSVDFAFSTGLDPLYELGRHTDCWGVGWNNVARGFDSHVVSHPLADWAAFGEWKQHLPDPMRDSWYGPPRDWQAVRKAFNDAKRRGDLASAWGLEHGFFFMNLYYLRGFENLMVDLATKEARINDVMDILRDHCVAVTRNYLDLGAEIMAFGDDLGMQDSLPISPPMWRRTVKPAYEAIFGPCRDRGVPVFLHSDGHILEIIPDLIEAGVRELNPQIGANGLGGLQEMARGKVAINLDLDRQFFPFASPSQVAEHITEAFDGLYLPEGGLVLLAWVGPEVPLENVEAICHTFEKLCKLPDQRA